jgi:type I restriction enzyme, S subunit
VKKLGDVLDLAYGKALRADARRPGDLPVYGSNGPVGWHDEHLVDGPGIVVERKGNPGITTWVPTDFYPIDTTFFVVSKLDRPNLRFLYEAVRVQDLASLGAASAVPGLNRNLAYLRDQLVTSPAVLELFARIVDRISNRAHRASEESRTLAALRDTLLSKLISGELQMKDNYRFIETNA